MSKIDEAYLLPTAIIDSDSPDILEHAEKIVGTTKGSEIDQAIKLFYAVRDGIWYDPYYPFYRPEHYRASNVLKSGRGYCVSKASLLCALGRARKIPSRLGFANVRNHLATRQLIEFLGSDLFVYHGFTEFYLAGKWVKATPAFNIELCKRHKVVPLEFNGREDSIFQPYSIEKKKFMEYLDDHGTFSDVPLDDILSAWKKVYGKERVKNWIEAFEKSGGKSPRDFAKEDVI
ncbi:MAG: transglutaminase-like domain-containing protein [Deltaproteobacteria bacterium]|nr:transglutaminase-like domain-containing protein [Deltaproteobacteria bacterium]MBT8358940.1 transglutaminase-like domain-containing protein [Deltaproteobacteria bacterium]MBT8374057.1 transglutaminase-like domain-containing protein [Deltaproteobacteria bacterium]NNK86543.1 transglutaminase domain-containing protein [Desulfobacterales bacterium]NNL43507.1 transglutaminase domain-containing protein [Desulfobacterales bacterium]